VSRAIFSKESYYGNQTRRICNRQHSAFIAFLVNMGEATFGKLADHWLCEVMSMGTI
jgi:hypothetical protein